MFVFPIGWSECLIILVVVAIVVALAFRSGAARGRRRK
jgi:Sec-independent protein translocase protein TatA